MQVRELTTVWVQPHPVKIYQTQLPDGSWKYPGKILEVYPPHHYSLVETWKQLRIGVDQYGFISAHPAAERAAEFLFSCQTEEGDIRGMIGNQYATYYTGAIMSLLIKAGYADDPRIEKGFQWLLSMRQDDGGWTIPILTVKLSRQEQHSLTSSMTDPVEPDRSRPFSHNWTGMVLRAFAAHPTYRRSEAAIHGARLLKSRFFKNDVYSSYKSAENWLRFQYPFWWNNLVSALDSISLIDPSRNDPQIQNALDWFVEHQQPDGLWLMSYSRKHKTTAAKAQRQMGPWLGLAIGRIFKRFFDR
jgi:hypothetical protein